jgi:IS5 family transposase
VLPEQMSVHLDRGYDSRITREKLEDRGLLAVISERQKARGQEAHPGRHRACQKTEGQRPVDDAA